MFFFKGYNEMKLQLLSLASLSFVYWKVVFQVRVSLSYTFSFEKGDIFRMPCKSKNVRFLEKSAHFLAIKFFSVSIVMYVGARIVWFPVKLHGKNFKKLIQKVFCVIIPACSFRFSISLN